MFWKILSCLWLPILCLVLSVINIIRPLKIKGALLIRGSRKNENTWNYSQRLYSFLLLGLVIILLVLAFLWINKANTGNITWDQARVYIVIVSVIFLLIPIPLVRLALVRKFDEEGNYKH